MTGNSQRGEELDVCRPPVGRKPPRLLKRCISVWARGGTQLGRVPFRAVYSSALEQQIHQVRRNLSIASSKSVAWRAVWCSLDGTMVDSLGAWGGFSPRKTMPMTHERILTLASEGVRRERAL